MFSGLRGGSVSVLSGGSRPPGVCSQVTSKGHGSRSSEVCRGVDGFKVTSWICSEASGHGETSPRIQSSMTISRERRFPSAHQSGPFKKDQSTFKLLHVTPTRVRLMGLLRSSRAPHSPLTSLFVGGCKMETLKSERKK